MVFSLEFITSALSNIKITACQDPDQTYPDPDKLLIFSVTHNQSDQIKDIDFFHFSLYYSISYTHIFHIRCTSVVSFSVCAQNEPPNIERLLGPTQRAYHLGVSDHQNPSRATRSNCPPSLCMFIHHVSLHVMNCLIAPTHETPQRTCWKPQTKRKTDEERNEMAHI